MVVELEHMNHSFPHTFLWLPRYFALIPSHRRVIGIKTYGNPLRFGAIAVMSNCGLPQRPYDAIVGTAPLTKRAKLSIRKKIEHHEWQLGRMDRPVLHINVADLLYLDDASLLVGAPPTTERLEIDLCKDIFEERNTMRPPLEYEARYFASSGAGGDV